MENRNFILKKFSSFFLSSFSSCQFRVLPDVAESSILIPKKTNKTFHEKDLKKEPEQILKKNLTISKHGNRYNPSDKNLKNSDKKQKQIQECKKIGTRFSVNQSSSATSGWFSSNDEKTRQDAETATIFSFSSNSRSSLRLNSTRSFGKCEKKKSIDETFNTVPINQKPKYPTKNVRNKLKCLKSGNFYTENELGFDQISAQIYYSKSSHSGERFRCRKIKNRGELEKKRQPIEESYAVEKGSSDPYGDFTVSMVEMIVGKQIFGAEDLERLLNCFLNFNEVLYHEMIVDVFCEVCEILFSN